MLVPTDEDLYGVFAPTVGVWGQFLMKFGQIPRPTHDLMHLIPEFRTMVRLKTYE